MSKELTKQKLAAYAAALDIVGECISVSYNRTVEYIKNLPEYSRIQDGTATSHDWLVYQYCRGLAQKKHELPITWRREDLE